MSCPLGCSSGLGAPKAAQAARARKASDVAEDDERIGGEVRFVSLTVNKMEKGR